MRRPNLTQILAALVAVAIASAILSVVLEGRWLNVQATRAILVAALLLPLAPAISLASIRPGTRLPQGLRTAGRLTAKAGILFGILFIAVMFIGLSVTSLGLFFCLFAIAAGAFALYRARTAPTAEGGHRALAYFGPAVLAIVIMVTFTRLERASQWDDDRLRVGVYLEHIATQEEMVRADSGHYTDAIDTTRHLRPEARIRGPFIVRTADGYVARAGHRNLTFQCLVYTGTPPADLDRIRWSAGPMGQPRLRPRQVGCFRGVEDGYERTRQLRGLGLMLAMALAAVALSWV